MPAWLIKPIKFIIVTFGPELVTWVTKKIKALTQRVSRDVKEGKAVKEVENATTKEELDRSFDNLP